ncbi:hypothetical protein V1525DRAFT_395801 [Lipomyces kononenkoae]|uniref:Uncharacterized protein n=1 Tax=Lipomyces kononenkoae TaxID=34357 RepID=A0ACC3T9C9_LIPKO
MDDSALSASDSRNRPRSVLRRASINLSSLTSAHPPVFFRTAATSPKKYEADLADDLIVNHDDYYKPRPYVRIPIMQRDGAEGVGRVQSKAKHGRTKSGRIPTSKSTRTSQQSPSNLLRETRPAAPGREATIAGSITKESERRSNKEISMGALNVDDVKYDLTLSAEWSHLLALMKKMKGVIRGWAKWHTQNARGSGYCYTEEFSGALLFEERESAILLMNDLRGCRVSLSPTSSTAIHVRSSKDPSNYVVIEPHTSADFSRWLAVLLSWAPLRAAGISSKIMRFRYPRLDYPHEPDNKRSDKINASITPVRTIKVGRIEMWDPSLKLARKGKQPVTSTHNWVSASCFLKTNGEMQVFPDTQSTQSMSQAASPATEQISGNVRASLSGNNLDHSSGPLTNGRQVTFQLSTIRRSAIQKADPSLTGRDNCIVIFLKTAPSELTPSPSQITIPSSDQSQAPTVHQSSISMHQQHPSGHYQSPSLSSATSHTATRNREVIVTPIYIFFDSKTNFEVWFMLLRSLSLPELYGPDTGRVIGSFRQQRVLNMRIIDAKILAPRGSATNAESAAQLKSVDSYVDIELNDRVRARTRVKYGTSKPFWREDFSFPDLPFLVNSVKLNLRQRNKKIPDLQSDTTIGEVRMLISDIPRDSDLERWIPIYNPSRGYMGKTGELCVRMQVSEFTILASCEYNYIQELLLDFPNRLTIELSHITGDLKRLSNTLLDIFQATGQVTDWLISLAEDEINDSGSTSLASNLKEEIAVAGESDFAPISTSSTTSNATSDSASTSTPTIVTRPFSSWASRSHHKSSPSCSSRLGPTSDPFNGSAEGVSSGCSPASPTLTPTLTNGQEESHESFPPSRSSSANLTTINSAAIADANLLFRGNSLLTKSLDSHMRRIGHDYIVDTLSDVIKHIVDENAYCEVDPTKLTNPEALNEHWDKLHSYTSSVWDKIRHSARQCPPGLRRIFHNTRLQIENRFGEFLNAAWYSGISGFLFLRFFCPAIMSPKLFGLVQDHPPARTQRTLTLVAKGLQGLANRTQFGTKEPWMAPMNTFLNRHVHEFTEFITEVSTWQSKYKHASPQIHYDQAWKDFQDDTEAEVNKRSLSMVPYQIPRTILSRLPSAFRDSAPTLPYLIDQPAALAELVEIWLQWYDAKVADLNAQRASATAAAAVASNIPSSMQHDQEGSNDGHRSSTSSRPNTAEGFPDQYAYDSDDILFDTEEERTDDDSVDHVHVVDSASDGRPVTSPDNVEEEDAPSGITLTGALLLFHHECMRIRTEIQKLRYKSSIPEIPSEVPPETWDHYVAHFLDRSEFHFARRASVLKSLFLGGSSGGRNDGSSKVEDSERANFEPGDDEYCYFPTIQPQNPRPSIGDAHFYSMPPNVVIRSEGSGQSTGSGSSDSSLGGNVSTSLSRGLGSVSKKSKGLKLPAWRKFLGPSSSVPSKKET